MKRILAFALAATVAMPALFAQDRGGWKEKIRSERVAFITEELSLTPAEAEKFWPVYNIYRDRKSDVQKDIRNAYRALDEADRNGAVTETLINDYVKALDSRSGIETEALKEYSKILPPEKIAKLYLAEERFRMQQIHRLHHGDGKDGQRGPAAEPGKGPRQGQK